MCNEPPKVRKEIAFTSLRATQSKEWLITCVSANPEKRRAGPWSNLRFLRVPEQKTKACHETEVSSLISWWIPSRVKHWTNGLYPPRENSRRSLSHGNKIHPCNLCNIILLFLLLYNWLIYVELLKGGADGTAQVVLGNYPHVCCQGRGRANRGQLISKSPQRSLEITRCQPHARKIPV